MCEQDREGAVVGGVVHRGGREQPSPVEEVGDEEDLVVRREDQRSLQPFQEGGQAGMAGQRAVRWERGFEERDAHISVFIPSCCGTISDVLLLLFIPVIFIFVVFFFTFSFAADGVDGIFALLLVLATGKEDCRARKESTTRNQTLSQSLYPVRIPRTRTLVNNVYIPFSYFFVLPSVSSQISSRNSLISIDSFVVGY